MKWFKHDSNASRDKKLQNVIIDYGMEGYGLYWYCVELVAEGVGSNNLTFELEHDARIISRATGVSEQRVNEIMRYFVDQKLFENNENTITCLKLAKRLDETTSKSPQVKQLLNEMKSSGILPAKKGIGSGVNRELIGNNSGADRETLRPDKTRQDKTILKDQDNCLAKAQPDTKAKRRRVRFVKPTVEQIYEHMISKGVDDKAEAEYIWNFYESKNWLVGKTKMSNWKAVVTNWINRNAKTNTTGNSNQPRRAGSGSQSWGDTKPSYEIAMERAAASLERRRAR